MSEKALCNQCKIAITTTSYVKCYSCNSNYHFATCSSISEATYLNMSSERKTSWKCQICRPSRSPNLLVFDDKNQQKQTRANDDDENDETDRTKKFKETLSLTAVNSKLCSVQSDVKELKSDIKEIKKSIEQVSTNVSNSNLQIKQDIQTALTTITNTLTTLVGQVKELFENDKKRETQITAMDTRINKLEQQLIVKNIEIKNIKNKQMSAYDVVKTIGASLNVVVNEEDVSRAYRLKKQNDKVVIEFSSLGKKIELMSKIERHRVDANVIKENINTENNSSNVENSSHTNKYIYINDQLTFTNRRLLWLAKTKAIEAKWKFVWVRNGNIFARKNENSSFIIISNAADIESINNAL